MSKVRSYLGLGSGGEGEGAHADYAFTFMYVAIAMIVFDFDWVWWQHFLVVLCGAAAAGVASVAWIDSREEHQLRSARNILSLRCSVSALAISMAIILNSSMSTRVLLALLSTALIAHWAIGFRRAGRMA